jgi:hypothetical protein
VSSSIRNASSCLLQRAPRATCGHPSVLRRAASGALSYLPQQLGVCQMIKCLSSLRSGRS